MAYTPREESTKTWTMEELDIFRMTHVLKAGDDGIPNIRSDDNALVDKIRQKPIATDFIHKACESDDIEGLIRETYGDDAVRNYHRNKQLVDLDFTPQHVQDAIVAQFHEAKRSGMQRNKFLNYLIENKLAMLVECSSDF